MDMLPLNSDHKGAKESLEYKNKLENAPEELEIKESDATHDEAIYNVQDVPKELNIFTRTEEDFLPAGKTFEDLTPEELRLVRSQYRFSPFRPGMYQTITGISPTS